MAPFSRHSPPQFCNDSSISKLLFRSSVAWQTENLNCNTRSHTMPRMRKLILLLVLPVSLFAQQGGGGGRGGAPPAPPKNLKLLAPTTDIRFVMQSFNEALGVQCTYCHVQGDFAADTNPKKEMARKMIAMVRLT